jgi:hypothetical protein
VHTRDAIFRHFPWAPTRVWKFAASLPSKSHWLRSANCINLYGWKEKSLWRNCSIVCSAVKWEFRSFGGELLDISVKVIRPGQIQRFAKSYTLRPRNWPPSHGSWLLLGIAISRPTLTILKRTPFDELKFEKKINKSHETKIWTKNE